MNPTVSSSQVSLALNHLQSLKDAIPDEVMDWIKEACNDRITSEHSPMRDTVDALDGRSVAYDVNGKKFATLENLSVPIVSGVTKRYKIVVTEVKE